MQIQARSISLGVWDRQRVDQKKTVGAETLRFENIVVNLVEKGFQMAAATFQVLLTWTISPLARKGFRQNYKYLKISVDETRYI